MENDRIFCIHVHLNQNKIIKNYLQHLDLVIGDYLEFGLQLV